MVEFTSEAWEGVITDGELEGYELEVRRQRFPWSLYVFAFTAPDAREEPMVGFAVGREKLAGHLESLGVAVTWEDGRGPLAPERDRVEIRLPRRRRRSRRARLHLRPMCVSAGFSTTRAA
ncbi:MAG: hypothetical protein QF464_04650 [Myxococcota bacterium]|nr:hypothetical protein [Myxococcota bacterium]